MVPGEGVARQESLDCIAVAREHDWGHRSWPNRKSRSEAFVCGAGELRIAQAPEDRLDGSRQPWARRERCLRHQDPESVACMGSATFAGFRSTPTALWL